MNAIKSTKPVKKVNSSLLTIFKKAKKEYEEIDEMFKLLGWEDLPISLKLIIEDDIKGYVDELTGQFSTNCSLVQRRRESVDFWVKSYLNDLCTLETAMEFLKVRSF